MILDVHEPYISYSVIYSNIFSVIDINEQTLPWILDNCMKVFSSYSEKSAVSFLGLTNFINLFYNCVDNYTEMYENCIFIKNNIYDMSILKMYESDSVSILKNFIKSGGYILANVNTKYIKIYKSEKDGLHGLFIYGYDDSSQMFYVSDFFGGSGKKYQRAKVSYQEVVDGLEKASLVSDPVGDYIKGVQVWHKKDDIPYYIYLGKPDNRHTERVIKDNMEWLLSNHTYVGAYKTEFEIATGVFVYDHIIRSLKFAYSHDGRYDYKPLDCLIEHKKIMILAIKFLIDQNVAESKMLEEYEELKNLCFNTRNLVLKCKVSKYESRAQILERIYENVTRCAYMEERILKTYLNS